MSVRTRFAPSPTGFMHIGGVRTALYAWLFARKHGGQFVLRIEDTDKAREVEGAIGHIMESLRWIGIDWDEGTDVDGPYAPYIQSSRLSIYRAYAERLIAGGHAYADPYSEEELEAFRKEAEEAKRPFLFRDHRPETVSEWDGTKPLRFKVPVLKRYVWQDEVLGELSAGEEALDDFILIKGDGYPTYNFAHVVDDIEMKITHVMRGQEFVASTPKFLSLYDALEEAPPAFATLPPILGDSGTKKLSKRDGAKDILEYREEGYLPEAMMNFLALIGWNPGGDRELFSPAELIAEFSLERIQRSGGRFDETKLLHLNQEWMRLLSDEEYVAKGGLAASDPAKLLKLVPELKERATTFVEARTMLTEELSYIFSAPALDRDLLISKEPSKSGGETERHLAELKGRLALLPEEVGMEGVKLAIMPYADQVPKEEGGRGVVLWPLRYALSGRERSPDPFSLVHILGIEESSRRIDAALAIL